MSIMFINRLHCLSALNLPPAGFKSRCHISIRRPHPTTAAMPKTKANPPSQDSRENDVPAPPAVISTPAVSSSFEDDQLRDLMMAHSVSHARSQAREGPWYSAWMWVCVFFIIRVLSGPKKTTLFALYPQYPVEAQMDNNISDVVFRIPHSRNKPVDRSKDDQESSDGHADAEAQPENVELPVSSEDELNFLGPSLPRSIKSSHDKQPSPVAQPHHHVTDSDEFNHIPTDAELLASETKNTFISKLTEITSAVARSTRIPDSLVTAAQVNSKFNAESGKATILREHTVLIIEIKSKSTRKSAKRLRVRGVHTRQVFEQAWHVFRKDPALLRVGCLIGLGDEWHYTECTRDDVRGFDQKLDKSGRSEPKINIPDLETATSLELEKIFAEHKTIPLLGSRSRTALQLVARRLEELSQDLWQDVSSAS